MGNTMNGDLVREQKKQIVFAVDQEPFDDSGKWFCFLYPLMTLDGERLEADPANFPNTGRVWWMIGDACPQNAAPGAVWTGPIEEHPGWKKSKDNPRHNRYQARKDAIRFGGEGLIEILSLPHVDLSPDLIYKGFEVSMKKPPLSVAFLQGKDSVLGPVKVAWDSERYSATFEALVVREFDPDHPILLKASLKDFLAHVRVEEFHYEAGQLDYVASPVPMSVRLTRKPWIQLDALRAASQEFDGLKYNELINWAVRTLDDFQLSRQEKRQLNAFVDQIRHISAPSHEAMVQRRVERLTELAEDVQKTRELGPEVATILGRSCFAELVEQHLETIVEDTLRKEIDKRRKEIEASIRGQKKELRQLEQSFEERRAAQDKALEEQTRERQEALAQKQQELQLREEQIETQRQALEQARDRFAHESQDLFRQWLELFPMFGAFDKALAPRVMALPEAHHPVTLEHPSAASHHELPAVLALPDFLHHARPTPKASDALSEEAFLVQLQRVAKEEGFLFDNDDLFNFHICAKTGYLTILAGRTGMGKSSLPRLYSKALGCEDEYLHLSVRPDWLDDRDLLGAFNALSRRFEASPSGFTERLICAQQDWEQRRGGIYLTCLDEMNLARLEHYFAQFLSVLEKPARHQVIHLFGQGVLDPYDPYAPFREVRLHENIRFIGTVNIDETAFFLSPKVLDRAQVLVFQDPDLGAILPKAPAVPSSIVPVSLDTFSQWKKPPEEAGFARPFFLEIDRILRHSRLGFGFRQFDRMLTYVASAQGVLETHKAMDFQLMQVVLPRLRRTAPRFVQTLEKLMGQVDESLYPRSALMLQRIRESEGEDDFFQLI